MDTQQFVKFWDRVGNLTPEQQKDWANCLKLLEKGYRLYTISDESDVFVLYPPKDKGA